MKVFFGWILMAVGGLIALTCGLCTLGVAAYGVSGQAGSPPGPMSVVMMALIFGGVPTAAGVGLFILGLRLTRGPKPPEGDGYGE